MKRVKILICSVLALGIVAGSLAFKVKSTGFYVYTKSGTICPIATPNLQVPTTTATEGTVYSNVYTTKEELVSVASSLCSIPTLRVKPE